MADHALVVRVATFVPEPGRFDDLVAAARLVGVRASAAPGCFGARVCGVGAPRRARSDLAVGVTTALDDFLAGQREMMRAALAEPPSTSHYTVLADGG